MTRPNAKDAKRASAARAEARRCYQEAEQWLTIAEEYDADDHGITHQIGLTAVGVLVVTTIVLFSTSTLLETFGEVISRWIL